MRCTAVRLNSSLRRRKERLKMTKKKKLVGILAAVLVFVVVVASLSGTFSNMHRVENYLALARAVGRSERRPVPLRVRIDLDNEWSSLISTINASGVDVNLNLRRSTMTGEMLNLGGGSSRIITLALPSSVTGLTGENAQFANLTRISFPASAEIDGNPFAGSPSVTFRTRGRGDLSTIERGRVLVRGNELVSFPSASGSITFGEITAIGNYAFIGNTNLQSVSFPAAVNIGNGAFAGNENLQTVNLPAAVTIGEAAFLGNTALESITLPAVREVGASAFINNTSLQTVNLPAAVTIGAYVFSGNTALETLNIPAATSIGNNMLASTGNTALAITTGNLQHIGSLMFLNVTTAKQVTLRIPLAEDEAIPGTLTFAFRGRGWGWHEGVGDAEGNFGYLLGVNRQVGWNWVANVNPSINLTIERR